MCANPHWKGMQFASDVSAGYQFIITKQTIAGSFKLFLHVSNLMLSDCADLENQKSLLRSSSHTNLRCPPALGLSCE